MPIRNCVLCGSDIVSDDIRDQACDDCAKNHFMTQLRQELTGFSSHELTDVEKVCDHLIRRGWRKVTN
jgi:ABC-type Na+ transport system ATPase subunit NatA